MNVTVTPDHASGDYICRIRCLDLLSTEHFLRDLVQEIVRETAKRFVADHYQELAERMSQDTIANLAVAESAGELSKTIKQKLPDIILEVVRTEKEVWQRGPLGGMRRIR